MSQFHDVILRSVWMQNKWMNASIRIRANGVSRYQQSAHILWHECFKSEHNIAFYIWLWIQNACCFLCQMFSIVRISRSMQWVLPYSTDVVILIISYGLFELHTTPIISLFLNSNTQNNFNKHRNVWFVTPHTTSVHNERNISCIKQCGTTRHERLLWRDILLESVWKPTCVRSEKIYNLPKHIYIYIYIIWCNDAFDLLTISICALHICSVQIAIVSKSN